jgi:hypothetical protein
VLLEGEGRAVALDEQTAREVYVSL